MALLAVLLVPSGRAIAHRLDQYLEASIVSLSRDTVTLRLRLTPGIGVAGPLIAEIDGDHNGILSPGEQAAYAERVRQDLAVSLDGRPLPLHLREATFPSEETLRTGSADIELVFDAAMTASGPGHVLTLENRHHPASAVYLANALVPADKAVQLATQQRSLDQSSYTLGFDIGPIGAAAKMPPAGRSANEAIVASFFAHGVHHILTGYDHLLFGAALVLGAVTLWDLLAVVTVFTIAHSITLTFAALDLVHLSSRIVEPLISASIVFVALQNVFQPAQARGPGRLAAAFFFGLFHGLGFAGGLLDIMHQMPTDMILLAILGFSLGVEAGNQMVLLPLFFLLKLVRRSQADPVLSGRLMIAIRRTGSTAVSVAGVYYLGLALTGQS